MAEQTFLQPAERTPPEQMYPAVHGGFHDRADGCFCRNCHQGRAHTAADFSNRIAALGGAQTGEKEKWEEKEAAEKELFWNAYNPVALILCHTPFREWAEDSVVKECS